MMNLTLFHSKTSVCSQKVRLVLAEKGLAYDSVLVDLAKGEQFTKAYLELNANGTVPTLKTPDRVIGESNEINLYLESLRIADPLLPYATDARSRCAGWMLQSQKLHIAINTITAMALKVENLRALSPQECASKLAGIPFPERRQKLETLVAQGVTSVEFKDALTVVTSFTARMDHALQRARFLVGAKPTLADFSVLPFIHRLELLTFDTMFSDRPNLMQWQDEMKFRPSFLRAVSAFHPPRIVEKYQIAGKKLWHSAGIQ